MRLRESCILSCSKSNTGAGEIVIKRGCNTFGREEVRKVGYLKISLIYKFDFASGAKKTISDQGAFDGSYGSSGKFVWCSNFCFEVSPLIARTFRKTLAGQI